MAAEFTTGAAPIAPRTVHDRSTARRIAGYRMRLDHATDAEVLAAAQRLDRPAASRHPLCAEFRAIVDAELAARHLSLASMAGGAK